MKRTLIALHGGPPSYFAKTELALPCLFRSQYCHALYFFTNFRMVPRKSAPYTFRQVHGDAFRRARTAGIWIRTRVRNEIFRFPFLVWNYGLLVVFYTGLGG